jgi:hypothetical protein
MVSCIDDPRLKLGYTIWEVNPVHWDAVALGFGREIAPAASRVIFLCLALIQRDT